VQERKLYLAIITAVILNRYSIVLEISTCVCANWAYLLGLTVRVCCTFGYLNSFVINCQSYQQLIMPLSSLSNTTLLCPRLESWSIRSFWTNSQFFQIELFLKLHDYFTSLLVSNCLMILIYVFQANWLNSSGYGGWMVWSLDNDDFTGSLCGGQTYPLLRALNSAVNTATFPSTATTTTTTTTRPSTVIRYSLTLNSYF